MKLFQNFGVYRSYRSHFDRLYRNESIFSFASRRDLYLRDRYGATHLLSPVLDRCEDAFCTSGDDEILQGMWARENGISQRTSLESILRLQIEAHRTEIFYNLDPVRYPSSFIRTLPGCVKKTIAWRAAPSYNADFTEYDRVVCNFPSILREFQNAGCKVAYFSPAIDPAMEAFARQEERPIDVIFVGGYSRHHLRRAKILEEIAKLNGIKVVLHLDSSRLTKIAESAIGRFFPLRRYRRPESIRRVAKDPIFGLELYEQLSKAKIVVNAAIDMAGNERGNMRCFEAMGLGCLLLSDVGSYPNGMQAGLTHLEYGDSTELIEKMVEAISKWNDSSKIAFIGNEMVRRQYSKLRQFEKFLELCN